MVPCNRITFSIEMKGYKLIFSLGIRRVQNKSRQIGFLPRSITVSVFTERSRENNDYIDLKEKWGLYSKVK